MLNKKSGFGIRFSARMLDLILVASIVVISAYLMMSHDGGGHFKSSGMYYIGTLEFVLLLFGGFILMPALFGKTLFMGMLGIEIIFEDENRLISMIKREFFFSANGIFMTLLVAVVINHTLITDYSKTNLTTKDKESFSSGETARISMVSAVGSILMVFQFIYAISIFVRGPKKGLHDSQSNTGTVGKNKFIKEVKEIKKDRIKPRPVNNNPVIGVD